MDVNVYSLAGNLIRELRDKIKADIEKEVYGLTAARGRDMKVRVDRLEAEVSRLKNSLRIVTKGKVREALPWIGNPELERLRIENDDLRDTIASDDATRRNMKVRVDRLEGEVESLHSVIKLKDDRLVWWRQTVDGKNRTIKKLEESKKLQEWMEAWLEDEVRKEKWVRRGGLGERGECGFRTE